MISTFVKINEDYIYYQGFCYLNTGHWFSLKEMLLDPGFPIDTNLNLTLARLV
jgi:hypothetical protein